MFSKLLIILISIAIIIAVTKICVSVMHYRRRVSNIGIARRLDVPMVVWTFWFGHGDLESGAPQITPNRAESLALMREHMEVPIRLITTSNLHQYTKWYVHPAVNFLSGVHKADYFRIYFLLYYGGGYSDIKRWRSSWKDAFDSFNDPTTWVVGVPELRGGVASPPHKDFSDSYDLLISNCFFSF